MPEVSPVTPLAQWTTLGLGGPASQSIIARSADEIVECVREARDAPLFVLAGGSNVVIGDDGFDGLAVLLRSHGWRIVGADPHDRPKDDLDHVAVEIEAGHPWDDFVAETVAEGLAGIECLSGIPGSAGATPIQNVGAYGQDVAEVVTGVTVYDRTADQVTEVPAARCDFGYRASRFKHSDRWIVTSVRLRLRRSPLSEPIRYAELATALGVKVGDHVPLADVREAVLQLRRGKGMVLDPADPDTRSVGSFFVNPVLGDAAWEQVLARAGGTQPPSWPGNDGVVKVSAAWLIEAAGFSKGYAHRGAAISGKHTLALTNRGGTTSDLLELAALVRDGVHEKFGVTLRPEPVLINCELPTALAG